MIDEFPGNAHSKAKPSPQVERLRKIVNDPPEEKKPRVEPIADIEVIRRKKPLGKRFFETFFGSDAKTVANYVVMDVLIPAAKDMVADAISQGVERTLFGEARSRSRRSGGRPDGNLPWTSYNRIGQSSTSIRRDEPRREVSRSSRVRHEFDEIVLPTRVQAEQVLDDLIEACSKYQAVTVADLYDLCGVTSVFTDSKWGWTDLRGADITRVRDGYLLDLPKPEPID